MKQNLVGKRFGKLLVIKELDERRNNGVLWECVCECGGKAKRTTGELNAGRRLTCGCMPTGSMGAWRNGKREKLYVIWCDIIQRCFDKNLKNYHRYGGRGITICDEWRHDYPAFRSWALSNGYKEGLSIDRINNNGNYEPNNCRWTTMVVQSRNKENTVFLFHNGERKPLMEWSESLGIKQSTIRERIRRGWEIEKALDTPVRHTSRVY